MVITFAHEHPIVVRGHGGLVHHLGRLGEIVLGTDAALACVVRTPTPKPFVVADCAHLVSRDGEVPEPLAAGNFGWF